MVSYCQESDLGLNGVCVALLCSALLLLGQLDPPDPEIPSSKPIFKALDWTSALTSLENNFDTVPG